VKQSDAVKHIRGVQIASQKARSNLLESLGDRPSTLGFLHPYLFPEHADPKRAWGILDMATRILDSKGDYFEPQDYMNLGYVLSQEPLVEAMLGVLWGFEYNHTIFAEWEPE